MKFTLTDEIPYPRDVVFPTLRDHNLELVPYLSNVDRIEEISRNVDGPVVRSEKRWHGSSSEVPAPLRPFITPELLSWMDFATWDQSDWSTTWRLVIGAAPDAIKANGRNTYEDDDDYTMVHIQGEFTVVPERLPIPTALARSVAPSLEKFIVGRIQPNMRETNKALATYIADKGLA